VRHHAAAPLVRELDALAAVAVAVVALVGGLEVSDLARLGAGLLNFGWNDFRGIR
jgi:hypothetical protein